MTDDKRMIGKVIKVHKDGYGFISCRDIPFTRIFFHWTSLLPETINFIELKKGDEVEFTPIELPDKGIRAIKIDVLEKEHVKGLVDSN